MTHLLLIAVGGAVGSVARYGTQRLLLRVADRATFPLGTLAANLLGCLLIGYLNGLLSERLIRPEYRFLLVVGVLGGYTTFSTFGLELAGYLRDGEYLRAAAYALASNVLGVVMVVLGVMLSRWHQ